MPIALEPVGRLAPTPLAHLGGRAWDGLGVGRTPQASGRIRGAKLAHTLTKTTCIGAHDGPRTRSASMHQATRPSPRKVT